MIKKEDNLLIIGTFIIIFVIRYITEETFAIKHGEIIYLISILFVLISLYSLTKKKYNNMSIFFSLTFLSFGLLPYCHYLTYSNNQENYSFNSEYLTQNTKNYKENLKNYKDSTLLLELKSKFYKVNRNIKLDDSLLNKKQKINDYFFILKSIPYKHSSISGSVGGRPNDRGISKIIDIYKNDQKITSLKLKSENFNDEINTYLNEKDLLNAKIKNPKEHIPFRDIWLDSVTGFIFSFIKPLSKISQIIRLTQLVIAYFLFHMISSWLKLSKSLNITEKDD